jgi:large subunit ribosomal protein L22
MEAYALHKGAMIAPRKARMTLDLIRGKDVHTAQGILENTNTKSSRLILKVLNSAIANAVNNNGANEADLVISECFINPGKVYKRIKFGSRTKVDRRDKRTSHITIKVSDNKEAK